MDRRPEEDPLVAHRQIAVGEGEDERKNQRLGQRGTEDVVASLMGEGIEEPDWRNLYPASDGKGSLECVVVAELLSMSLELRPELNQRRQHFEDRCKYTYSS